MNADGGDRLRRAVLYIRTRPRTLIATKHTLTSLAEEERKTMSVVEVFRCIPLSDGLLSRNE